MRTTLLTLGMIAASVAPGWADCMDGMRPTTDAEKQFYTETLTAVKAALPAAPTGWTSEDRNRISPPSSVCTGSGKLPFRADYEVRYYSQKAIAELNAKNSEFSKKIAELKQLPPEKQAQYDEIGRKGRDLDRQGRKLMATDKEAAAKLVAEGKELTNAAHEIRQAHLKSIAPQIDALSKEQYAATSAIGTEVRIKVNVNGFSFEPKPETTVLTYGKWDKSTKVLKPVYAAGPTTTVAAIAVQATGDTAQVKEVLAGLNTEALTALAAK